MKKIIILFTLLISLFSFSSCIAWGPASYRFDYDELKEQIISIELVNYDNNDFQRVKDKSSILPFDFNKMEIIEVLDVSQIEKFIDEFKEVYMMDIDVYGDSPTGISLKLTYECGDFILLSSAIIDKGYFNFIAIYDSEGQVKEVTSDFRDREVYVDLINKYFETQIA